MATPVKPLKPQEIGGTHYQQGIHTSPWDLQEQMESSGSAFVDARRCDALKYVFRKKGDRNTMLLDLEKARHCIEAAIRHLSK
jgi:hypothetical protein